jgi:hypothetical protein
MLLQGWTNAQIFRALAIGPNVPAKSGNAVSANHSRLSGVLVICLCVIHMDRQKLTPIPPQPSQARPPPSSPLPIDGP